MPYGIRLNTGVVNGDGSACEEQEADLCVARRERWPIQVLDSSFRSLERCHSSSRRKVKAHTTPEAVLAGVISADDWAGNNLAGAACKLVVLEHGGPHIREARHSANLAVTCMALDCAHWFCETASGD